MTTERVCILSAKRTVQGRFLGALSEFSAVDLAVEAGRAALAGIDPEMIDRVVLGNMLAAGQGMNIARQVALHLGLPISVPAFTVNMMCASGMQAVALAAGAIMGGEAKAVLCGGAESMSNAPYLLERARSGYRFGDGKLIDVMLRDGLCDGYTGEHMGMAAERLARQCAISRDEQDAFALRSHQRVFRAREAGLYDDELVPVGDLDHDEHPRADTSAEKLAGLRPVFDPKGSITAANASGINDGAAMLVVSSEETAQRIGSTPLAVLDAWAAVGCEPKLMGLGPVHATRKLCEEQGCELSDFDTIEINEAFAAQVLACLQKWEMQPGDVVNPDGGAIALGHPVGASAARLLVHLAHRIARGRTRRALATLCVGGGMGMSMTLRPAADATG